MQMSRVEFFKRTLIVLAVALVPVLVWALFDVILMAMGAVVIAVLLRLGAEPFTRWLKLPQGVALALSGILILAILGGTGYLFGTRIAAEMQDVLHRAGTAQKSIRATLNGSELGKLVLSHVRGSSLSIPTIAAKLFTVSATFLEGVVVTVLTGIYLAAQHSLYSEGLILLFPKKWRANAIETVDDVANALRLWLIGQLIQMVLIGVLSTCAVWLIGLPSPLGLGMIAAVAEFVPYLGPILAAIPAVLVAATKSFDAVIWTIAAYLLIHQIEGDLIVPLIQRHMIFIPPAIILLGIVAISFVFGTIAIVFAAPMAVVIFVLVKKLYVRDCLGEPTPIPGEPG
jgi:predicted PurR-regulated permease PerM